MNDFFLESGEWLDKKRIALLPLEHGSSMENQLQAAEAIFVRYVSTNQPFCLIRLGDAEIAFLSGGLFNTTVENEKFERTLAAAGITRDALFMRPLLIDAIRRTDLIGLQQHWRRVTWETYVTLSLLGVSVPMSNAVEVHLPYHLLTNGMLFNFLENHRVLIIGNNAENLAELLKTPGSKAHYSFTKILRNVSGVNTPARYENPHLLYHELTERVLQEEFDVAVVGFGVYAKPLCVAIRDSGRTAIDAGYCLDALLGGTERRRRPVFRDVDWDAEKVTAPGFSAD